MIFQIINKAMDKNIKHKPTEEEAEKLFKDFFKEMEQNYEKNPNNFDATDSVNILKKLSEERNLDIPD